MGFEPQIRQIISLLPENRQNLFFSATWPKEVQHLASEFLNNPVHISIGDENKLNANKNIEQHILVVKRHEKENKVLNLLVSTFFFFILFCLFSYYFSIACLCINYTKKSLLPAGEEDNMRAVPKTIIFRSRKTDCEDLMFHLRELGYPADSLHGDKSQALRERVSISFFNIFYISIMHL